MDLSVSDVARLLGVEESVIYRWARWGDLPSQRLYDQYRFNQVELQEWALVSQQQLVETLLQPHDRSDLLLSSVLSRGSRVDHLVGSHSDAVIEVLAHASSALNAAIDWPLIREVLNHRVALASLSIGEGVLIPHPRAPIVLDIPSPILFLGFPLDPVAMGTQADSPTRAFFLLLSRTVREHLQIVAQLSFALQDATFAELIQAKASQPALVERLRCIEQGIEEEPHVAGGDAQAGVPREPADLNEAG